RERIPSSCASTDPTRLTKRSSISDADAAAQLRSAAASDADSPEAFGVGEQARKELAAGDVAERPPARVAVAALHLGFVGCERRPLFATHRAHVDTDVQVREHAKSEARRACF